MHIRLYLSCLLKQYIYIFLHRYIDLHAATPTALKMDALNDQGLATGDSEEVKENCLAGNESVATAQKRTTAGNSSPPIADQGASKRALGDSLPAGCYDDPGELDYDESMEGDREQLAPAGIQTSGCVPEEVEEGEVTSDEEGEIKGGFCVLCRLSSWYVSISLHAAQLRGGEVRGGEGSPPLSPIPCTSSHGAYTVFSHWYMQRTWMNH